MTLKNIFGTLPVIYFTKAKKIITDLSATHFSTGQTLLKNPPYKEKDLENGDTLLKVIAEKIAQYDKIPKSIKVDRPK